MKLENLKEFIASTKTSKSTIYRFYKKNKELFEETKLKSGKRVFPVEHVKYFDSEIMHEENKILRLQNQSMKNLINGLMDRQSLTTRLWYLDWSFVFTVAYKLERRKESCYRQMSGLYEMLEKKYGNETTIRLFFTTEPFAERKGYHNHFILQIGNKKLNEGVVNDVKEHFSYDRVDGGIYDPFKAVLFYVAKDGLVGEDWDIMGNNLINDGINEN
jgi:predicted DNA-binding transcriptional regulator AlpA